MLRIYICPQCGSTRIVSNNRDSSCFFCSQSMHLATISYEEYVQQSKEQREAFITSCLNKLKDQHS